MSPLLRGGLAVAGLAGAFAAGFFLKPAPATPTVAAQHHPIAAAVSRNGPTMPAADLKLPDVAMPDADVKPATVLGPPASSRPEPDPLDAAGMAMIRKELGIKTTIRDRSEPVPAVLAGATKADDLPPVPQSPPVAPPPAGPFPMGGPTPRLDPPPAPMIPTITLPPAVADAPVIVPPVPNRPRSTGIISTRDVALDFQVTRTGPSKVTAVELWTTRDGGKTWACTDRMAGCQSPFRTRLGSDGQYGFRLVFENEAGVRTPEPRPGNSADDSIWLDTKPPRVTDITLEPVAVAPLRVRVYWSMSDENLDAEATRIEYSPDGRAWHPARLGPELGSDGGRRFTRVWDLPPGQPHRLMIRVTARDKAGNEATAELPKPVSIDLLAPEGKVTGVRPVGDEVGPMPREVVQPQAASARPRTLVELLTDSGWKPSTATPDSCRWEPAPAADRSPFDGAIDVVMPPGRPPAPVVARGGCTP